MSIRVLLAVVMVFLVGCDDSTQSPERKPFSETCDREVIFNESHGSNFQAQIGDKFITPTELVPKSEWPIVSDDLDFNGLELALSRQLKRFSKIDLSGSIVLGDETYPLTRAKDSLQKFKLLIGEYRYCTDSHKYSREHCSKNFQEKLLEKFYLYRPKLSEGDPRYGEPLTTLFTGYYTPLLDVRETRTGEYIYPIYKKPTSDQKANSTRKQIDFEKKLEGQGLELYYAKNLFDLYLLHVQGGGRVKLPSSMVSNRPNYLTYGGTNDQKWTFISTYMREQGMISDGSIESQRKYLNSHPEKQEEIFSTCPSYVYFRKSSKPPEGSDRVSLTDNRSIATDINYYKFKGLLTFVLTQRPVESINPQANCNEIEFKDFSRFYIDQDTGGAIRGKARADLYFGEGDYAEYAAYNLVKTGQMFFLILK